MKPVRRFDAGELKSPTYTKEGFLKCEAFITRTGIFKYMMPDGSIRRELRHPEDVFDTAHLESFKNVPVTNEHPWENVTVDNWNEVAVGQTGGTVEKSDPYVKSDMLITDKQSILDVMERRKDQVSCGYDCMIEMVPGEWNGEPYDARQRNMRGNHVALVPYGRAGDNVKIKIDAVRMDSQDAILVDFIEVDPSKIKKSCDHSPSHVFSNENKSEGSTMKIKIDGLEYEVSETVAKAVHDALAKKDTEIASLKSETEGLKGKNDALETAAKAKDSEIKKMKEDAIDEKKAVVIAKARLEVEDTAKAFLGEDFDMEKLTVADIKKAVVEKVTNSKMDGKSESYIDGQFDVYKNGMDSFGFSSVKDAVSESVTREREVQKKSDKPTRYDSWKSYEGPKTSQ